MMAENCGSTGLNGALEEALRAARPTFWANPGRLPLTSAEPQISRCRAEIDAAEQRLLRMAPLLAIVFPELVGSSGIIESPLLPVPIFARRLELSGIPLSAATLLVKADHALPVSGSVKARGGIHAVLAAAERIADAEGLLTGHGDERTHLASAAVRACFAQYTMSVGSTGNLGMSIGIAGRALGFRVVVHMSAEAKQWKKDRLRGIGAIVVEHQGDYGLACATARAEATGDPRIRFIDDENSPDLFYGYAVAGRRLAAQLSAMQVTIDADRPLILHLPCGVGGAPGGIALGARLAFGDSALAFTAEPVQAPCMLMGLASGRHDEISATDIGLHGRTLADGLAVSRPSQFVGRLIAPLLDGCATVADQELCKHVAALHHDQALRLEPSATAGVGSLRLLLTSAEGRTYCDAMRSHYNIDRAVQVIWATGGSQIPEVEFGEILRRAASD